MSIVTKVSKCALEGLVATGLWGFMVDNKSFGQIFKEDMPSKNAIIAGCVIGGLALAREAYKGYRNARILSKVRNMDHLSRREERIYYEEIMK